MDSTLGGVSACGERVLFLLAVFIRHVVVSCVVMCMWPGNLFSRDCCCFSVLGDVSALGNL